MQPKNPDSDKSWINEELQHAEFGDSRLGRRLRKILQGLSDCVGGSIPFAFQDWGNTKAAYRFFSNPQVSEQEILSGHFASTSSRIQSHNEKILVLHDTCEFSFLRDGLGMIGRPCVGKRWGIPYHVLLKGILMHSSLAVTQEGLPLGLTAIKFWSRSKFKGCNALKRKINPTRIPIEEKESYRWLENIRQTCKETQQPEKFVHIGDRESDIYELFCTAQEEKTHFLVRTCVDRLAGEDGQTISSVMKKVKPQGDHLFTLQSPNHEPVFIKLKIQYHTMQVRPPIGKESRYPRLLLTVIYATEENPPKDRKPIQWKLLTDLSVNSLEEAIEKIGWYSQRWKIEMFHKILKSGCKAEESKLRTSERLANLISVFCIVSWRIFWMTMMHREEKQSPSSLALTCEECEILDQLIPDKCVTKKIDRNLGFYLKKIAQLGGYLNRNGDSPPGNMVMWRGMTRLADIQSGVQIAKLVGN